MARPTLFGLNLDEYNKGFFYYPFMVNLDRYNRTCKKFDDKSGRTCVSNKTEDVNLSVFNMIIAINESRKLTKDKLCKFMCKFDGRKFNLNQNWNNDKCRCECKNPKKYHACKKGYVWSPSTCNCENGKYLGSITGSAVNCV